MKLIKEGKVKLWLPEKMEDLIGIFNVTIGDPNALSSVFLSNGKSVSNTKGKANLSLIRNDYSKPVLAVKVNGKEKFLLVEINAGVKPINAKYSRLIK